MSPLSSHAFRAWPGRPGRILWNSPCACDAVHRLTLMLLGANYMGLKFKCMMNVYKEHSPAHAY